MKNKIKFTLAGLGAGALITASILYTNHKNTEVKNASIASSSLLIDNFNKNIREGRIPIANNMWINLAHGPDAHAAPAASCDQISQKAWESCGQKFGAYQHGALGYFNNSLCLLNKGFTSGAETTLCHFRESMGIDPDLNNLPQTISKSFEGITVTVEVVEPTESFATSAGYQAKGTVTVGNNTIMVIYWGGQAEESKGFLIQGAGDGMIGGKRASYIQWDLTASDQTVKVLSAEFPSGTYLSNAAPDPEVGMGDQALYGRASYNPTTKAVETQMVLITEERVNGGGAFGCYKMYAEGTKGGNMIITKTHDSLNNGGHLENHTLKTLDQMDGMQGVDSTDTANLTGNYSGSDADIKADLEADLGIAADAEVFDKSCNDIYTAGSSGGAFSTANSVADYTAAPSDIF